MGIPFIHDQKAGRFQNRALALLLREHGVAADYEQRLRDSLDLMKKTTQTSKEYPEEWYLEAPLGLFPLGMRLPLPTLFATPVDYAEALGEAYLSFVQQQERKSRGHYLTPVSIARFMADGGSYSQPHFRVLDPGSGTGVLSAAVCEAACNNGIVRSLHVDASESDILLVNLSILSSPFHVSGWHSVE